MKRIVMAAALGCALLLSMGRAGAVTVTVDQDAPWLGFMNVFELPANGGGYVFGSAWGTADLVAVFSGETLTLKPNSVNDPNVFWYQGGDGPGSPGNKIMDANFYVENDALNGQVVTFEGTVQTNTLTNQHTAVAFIKDFAPNYSSFDVVSVPLTPGPFSITLPTLGATGRHIQYGFTMNGPNVWITDVAPFGSVTIAAPGGADPIPGDFNGDQQVNGLDLTQWRTAFAAHTAAADADADGDSDGNDFLIWQSHVGGAPIQSVPEPASLGLLALASTLALAGLRKR